MGGGYLWAVFGSVVAVLLAADLGLFSRKAHSIQMREAGARSLGWLAVAGLFAILVYHQRGAGHAMAFVTGYLVELSLSADNVFLFAVLFTYFEVARAHQHRVLLWGILSAIAMRGAMIVAGSALLERFHWLFYVFGAFLVLTGAKMLFHRGRQTDFSENALARWLEGTGRVVPRFDGQRFFTRVDGRLYATRLLVVLALVEVTDLLFAVDSIPAVFAITTDPFIVFTSNVFAILGLRSLYFLLAGMMARFEYLSTGLAVILLFVGMKMLGIIHVDMAASLAVVVAVLAVSVVASLRTARRRPRRTEDSEAAGA